MDIEYIKQNAAESGSCKEAMHWYYLDGTLYIECSGELEWCTFTRKAVQTVVIAPGCTAIGEYVFRNWKTLKEISLPAGLRRIESHAFCECTNLEELVLPDGLEIIGKLAFCDCGKLSLTVPEDVTEIGAHAFQGIRELHYTGSIELDNDKSWETVILHCGTCDRRHASILTVNHEESFEGAEIAAYNGSVSWNWGVIKWNGQHPAPGQQLEIDVRSPFCCSVGDTFWAGYEAGQFAQAKLISILAMGRYSARIKIQILAVKNRLSFLKPVTKEKAEELLRCGAYDYHAPGGESLWIDQVDENTIWIDNSWGGGDISYYDYIYTDPNGIDHLIEAGYHDWEENCVFIGDKILGAHIHSWYRCKNDLFLDWREKTVIGCKEHVKEVIIPEGVRYLSRAAFINRPDLERIIVPESVVPARFSMLDCPKEVVLCGNSALTDKDFPDNVTITRTAKPAFLWGKENRDPVDETVITSQSGDLDLSGRTELTSLPEDLTVGGDLYLMDCWGLTSLPENLHVGRNLNLRGCTGLTHLPENLHVGRNLNLRGCTGLTHLPENLHVDGDLNLSGCAYLTSLPDNLTVGGDLNLNGCTGLSSLPKNMTVGGKVTRDGSGIGIVQKALEQMGENDGNLILKGLTALPEDLAAVPGNLDLSGCPGLTRLPDNLTVGEFLDLHGCTGLTSLPENLTVSSLDLSGCTGLTSLPENLTVSSLDLSGCPGLTRLPEHLTVHGDLDLGGCTGLTRLPDNLTVGEVLNLHGCTGLTRLPDNLTVGEVLNLHGCTGLTSLPENLTVSSLDLSGCTGLTRLPEHLHVGRRLNLSYCTGLTRLPDNLTVGGEVILDGSGIEIMRKALEQMGENGGNLILQGLRGPVELPNHLTVPGNLDLSGCTGLTSLPENLTVGGDLNLAGCLHLTRLAKRLQVGGDLILGGGMRLTGLAENLTVGGKVVLAGSGIKNRKKRGT